MGVSPTNNVTNVRRLTMRGLEGRIAVVTGGARGLGRAAAERLAEEGVKVGILDLRGDEANEVAQAIGGVAFACDTTDEAQLAAACEGDNAAFGGI
ncbi:MAG: SDR family NAD(P)-dependent oxidoreductase, partial [Chloroflexi bacterium]|nr:SDR family NAD(P)-dependent oxidoreductase [Chloroflexota bacterium]